MIIIMNIYNNVIQFVLNHYHSPDNSISVFPEDDNMVPAKITNDEFTQNYLFICIRSGISMAVGIPWPGLFSRLAGAFVEEFEVIPNRLYNTISYGGKEYIGDTIEEKQFDKETH